MTDEDQAVEEAFPDAPDAPTYSKLNPSQRKQALDAQIAQFEQEMAGHFSNWNRLKAMHKSAPAGEEGAEIRESSRTAAIESVKAIETIRIAIEATKAERATL